MASRRRFSEEVVEAMDAVIAEASAPSPGSAFTVRGRMLRDERMLPFTRRRDP
jgi:hypothetical protein